jgi:hypothetical protein
MHTTFLVGIAEERGCLEDNIKMVTRKIGYDIMICGVFVNTVMNLRFHERLDFFFFTM